MKVFLDSIGCRLNQSEIETMARQLRAAGHDIVTDAAQADKVVINTCAVTSEASRDARRMTRRIHRNNEDAEILLTGCYATIAPEELSAVKGAGRVVLNKDKDSLVQLIDPKARIDLPVFDREPIMREFLHGNVGNTRAFIKVQDGCDNKCTFCVTTVARGEGISRHLGDIVAEIQTLAAAGYQEAVLTGVHMGSYGHDFDNPYGLRELVKAILEHTDIPRLRLSSLEPWDIAPDFFTLWQNPRLLPHLHMPLQSGSDTVLRRMARRTRQESFSELVNSARENIAELNISTDVIVGFPGETEAEFNDSLDFVEAMNFSRLHVFTYSQRPGTAASTMPDQINGTIKKERVNRMISLGKGLSQTFHGQFVGRTMPVLIESLAGADEHGLRWTGYSDNYIRVLVKGGENLQNEIVPVKITGASEQGAEGIVDAG